MGFRDDLSVGLGIAGAAAVGGLTWFLNSPLLGVVSGVLLGTGLTMLAQSRTQRRTWKRELALKNIDTIYAPLYQEVDRMLWKTHSFNAQTGYSALDDSQWKRISGEYVIHFVPQEMRDQLESLYKNVNKFNTSLGFAYVEADKEIMLAASKFYGVELAELRYSASPYPGASVGVPLMNQALFGWHPELILKASFPNASKMVFYVDLVAKVPQGASHTKRIESAEDLAKFEDFFRELSTTIQSKPEVAVVKRTVTEISLSAAKIRDAILKLIKEPWTV